MQTEEKEIDKSISEQLIEEENNSIIEQHERYDKLFNTVIKIIRDEDMTVGEWGSIVESISQRIGLDVSLIKLNSIIKK